VRQSDSLDPLAERRPEMSTYAGTPPFAALTLSRAIKSAIGSEEAVGVPVAQQLPLIADALAFNRSLREAGDEDVEIVVAYQTGYRASVQVKDEIVLRSTNEDVARILGRSVRWHFVDVSGPDSLKRALSRNPAAIYIAPLRDLDVAAITAAATRAHVLTISSLSSYLVRGAAVGFEMRSGRSRILINPTVARAAGVDFSAQLLYMAEMVEP
jgi:hypothetical protein